VPNSLTVTATLSQEILPASRPARVVYLLLEIQPLELVGPTPRFPVNIGIVVDKSDSMLVPILSTEQFQEMSRQGAVREVLVDGVPVWQFEKVTADCRIKAPCSLDFVKQALRVALDKLSATDRFSLVAFARDAQVLVEAQEGTHKSVLGKAIDELDQLQLGSDTYLAAGLNAGYSQVKRGLTRERINRLIVLTDGFAFDATDCRTLAQMAAGQGIAISTLGLGVEFNEELLISLADLSGGNAYFINDASQITAAFAEELSGVQKITLRDLELKMRLSEGVGIRRALRVKPVISDLGIHPTEDRSVQVSLGDVVKDGGLVLLLEVLAPARTEGTFRLAQVALNYSDPLRGVYGEQVHYDFVMRYALNSSDIRVNPKVLDIVEQVSAFKLQTRALEEVRAGNPAGATQKLRAAATRLLNLGETDRARAALQEAENLEQHGNMTAAGKKHLRYDTRHLTQ
jgi:Ca-activated chloride channel family protein